MGEIIYTYYKEHKADEGLRKDVEDILQQSIFTNVALDGLLANHDDVTLRDKVHDVYRRTHTENGKIRGRRVLQSEL